MIMLGEVVTDYLERARCFVPERYPVLNREPRVQLDPRLWHLIHERDGGVCWMCGQTVAKGAGEIDHLVPRSSFTDVVEADRSWNLRQACIRCNQGKSNFRVPVLPRTFGITHRCWDCVERRDLGRPDPELFPEGFAEWSQDHPAPDLSVQAYCGSCGLMSWVPGEEWIL